jgi:signal transduction histidine kinase/ligand-binding sensor domain-containing protein/DNA-binding response OmpR family regulator
MGPKHLLSFALCILLWNYGYGQNNRYQFSHLDINNGLSNNQINCIYKDHDGFMWFGTTSGLNRYDGYKFRVFKNNYKDSNSISDNYILRIFEGPGHKMWVYTHNNFSIYDPATEKFLASASDELRRYHIRTHDLNYIKKDSRGKYWFITNDNGLYCYSSSTNQTLWFNHATGARLQLHSNEVKDIADCGEGVLWVIYNDGVLEKVNEDKRKIVDKFSLPVANLHGPTMGYSLVADYNQNLWIWNAGSQDGVYFLDTRSKTCKHFCKENNALLLKSNIINNVVIDQDNAAWIGTDHGGISVVDPVTFKITYLTPRQDDPKTLSGNSAVLYKTDDGIIWAGSYKQGISYYHKDVFQFPVVRNIASDHSSLPYEDVDCFKEDKEGNLWIGTNGGGLLYYDRTLNKYTIYKHDERNSNSLSNDVVIGLCIDHEGKLWIGTYFGGLDCFDGHTFKHFRHNDKLSGSIADDRIYAIFEDKNFNIWVGTFAGGINVYNRTTGKFTAPYRNLSSGYASVLYPDGDRLWVGEDKGIDLVDIKSGTVKHYSHTPNSGRGLVADDVNSITKDSRGLIWIGTKGGLSVLNPQSGHFFNLYEERNLPANNILDILEDDLGRMWLSSTNGIACVKVSGAGNNLHFDIDNFDTEDGLQGREFNVKAAYKTREGQMIFGGGHGFNIFDPLKINLPNTKPPLVFTDLQLFNRSVAVGDTIKGDVVLTKAITANPALTFNHNQNDFSIEFASCDFFNSRKIVYQYQLEGFDKGWLNASPSSRKATYTNLDAGDYVFKVRAYNINNKLNASIISLPIKVKPPFWKSPAAYVIYIIAFISGLYIMRRRGINKLKREFAAEQEKLEVERKIEQEREGARRLHELDLMKIKFFTNVSHEFRTPLSLILLPIEQLLKNNTNTSDYQQLTTIKKNSRRLLNLVNQLLDFRKMEFKELKLNATQGDIIEFIKDAANSFSDVAQKKDITYVVEAEAEHLITSFDQDKIERIMFNLLSNAFKFTPGGGNIAVLINVRKDEQSNKADAQILEIKIIDTGIGISVNKQHKIFNRFFQDDVPDNLLNQGSGIGLAITREFVKLHNGTIEVESEPGQGSCFTILLPVLAEAAIEQAPPVVIAPEAKKDKEHLNSSSKKPVVLLVEDNEDFRFYLKDNLKQYFQIIEAANGHEGWQKALGLQPNIIVSDVNMPQMNGLEFCKKIKADNRTTHMPVILLTAMCEHEDQLLGLESGANDYIMKPFNFEILLSKIHNLLMLQDTLIKTYRKQVDVNLEDINIESEDDKFIRTAIKLIDDNITNPNFSVEELSRMMFLSRVSLYKKMLTITGKTPVEFIRSIRLKKAVQLLEKSKLNIASVAYEVGFSNPTYFSKVFKEEYGMLPSDYLTRLKKGQTTLQDTVAD